MSLPVVDIRLFESASRYWPRHWHEEVQVVTSLSGRSRHQVVGSSEDVGPADLFVVNPGTPHTTCAKKDSTWRFITAHIPVVSFYCFQGENRTESCRSLSFSQSVIRHGGICSMLTALHRAVVEDKSLLYRDHCLQELLNALWGISREPLHLPPLSSPARLLLSRARDYLHEYFSAKITIKQLSDIAGVSEFHFCREFSRQFGLSPHAYQVQLRLLAAKRLLRQGSTIAGAADAVGFSSHSHLTRIFTRVNGISPRHYRKK